METAMLEGWRDEDDSSAGEVEQKETLAQVAAGFGVCLHS